MTNDNKMFAVSNYNPPGNYVGHFQANVLPRTNHLFVSLKQKIDK